MTMGRGGYHDLGGVDVLEPLDTSDKPMKFWELQIHCLIGKLASRSCMSVDEVRCRSPPGKDWLAIRNPNLNVLQLRRGIEALPAYSVSKRTYYEKWAAAASQILLERQVISRQDLDAALGLQGPEPTVRCCPSAPRTHQCHIGLGRTACLSASALSRMSLSGSEVSHGC